MLIVDASVALKFFVDEVDADHARNLIASEQPLVGPDWVLMEVASALQKKVGEQTLSEAHASTAIQALPEYFSDFYSVPEHLPRALRLAFQLGHPVYDCVYLELAMRLGSLMVTADAKFVKTVQRAGLGSHVRQLGAAI